MPSDLSLLYDIFPLSYALFPYLSPFSLSPSHIYVQSSPLSTFPDHLSKPVSRGLQRDVVYTWLTNSALVYEPKFLGGSCGILANEYSCVHHVTWSPNKLWRTTSIFSLCLPPFETAPILPFSFVPFLFNPSAPSPSFIQISLLCCTHLSLGFRVNHPTG
jgi:hypothetical protein